MAKKTLNDVKKELVAQGWGYALDLLSAIEKRARTNDDYAKMVDVWLHKNGSTIILRDICEPFRNSNIVKYYKHDLPMPFENMMYAIDSARCHLS